MKIPFRTARLVLISLALSACADSPTQVDPQIQAAAGTYGASGGFGVLSFTTTDTGETTDWLAAGATVSLRLNVDGTTAGQVFIPGADEDGGDFDENLAGTWSMNGDVVTLDHEADTFLRDMPFEVATDRLEGDHTFSGTRVRLTLQRQ